MRDLCRELARLAATEPFTPHDLRRTWTGDLLGASGELAIVQQLAEHASPRTTAHRMTERAAGRWLPAACGTACPSPARSSRRHGCPARAVYRGDDIQGVRGRRKEKKYMFVRVMYTTVFVRDQEQALDFYCGKLGLVKRRDHPVPDAAAWGLDVGRWLTVGFEGQDMQVILAPGTHGQGGANHRQGVLDRGELFIESDDLMKDFETLQSKGVQFVEPAPEGYPFGVRVTALDPDGNRVSLRQRPR